MLYQRAGSHRHFDGEEEDSSAGHSVRVTRPFGIPKNEWTGRPRRRARFLSPKKASGEEKGDTRRAGNSMLELGDSQTEIPTEAGVPESSQPLAVVADNQNRKPWESLVIGNLGENLSHIERKDREIEQQRFIVRYHEEHSPSQVDHNMRILDRLCEERSEMKDNEENNMPQDQREKKERISKRLEILRWALRDSRCDDERINIRAAIRGYENLLWLAVRTPCWGKRAFALTGTPLLRRTKLVLIASILNLRFDEIKPPGESYQHNLFSPFAAARKRKKKSRERDASCHLETLLDSGATFPIIFESDLARLNIDLSKYPAQGTLDVNTVGGKSKLKFYEMFVSVCTREGHSLVGPEAEAVWPEEPLALGGFCPVLIQRDPIVGSGGQRLSGMLPFDACYLSSAPGMGRLWLGEDRRDVLGTSRLPAHLRFDSDNKFILEYPEEFEDLRRAARTPDRVIFLHEFSDTPGTFLTDSDGPGARGISQLAIGRYQTVHDSSQTKEYQKALPQRVIQIEPRKGGIKKVPKDLTRQWKKHFNPA
ncbi:hypothetical protein NUW58_g4919 [Xylaria curta]|uniref:Uncharacterized protein n=1 Tax=Xylaria curta TaxID=42375 RepID=A0ACC1P511_9PEZI|nr:hypothetical protein NUW58_g4919 [Xylaria curta]